MAIWAYCSIVDGLREATVLAYRSTKSLRADRRALVKADEIRTNRLLQGCLRACIAGGYMRELDEYLLVYQYVNFCHAWALKHWALRAKFSLGKYVAEGIGLLVEPFLTARGRTALSAMRLWTVDFTREIRPLAAPSHTKRKRAPLRVPAD
jgi:hypothetical protein